MKSCVRPAIVLACLLVSLVSTASVSAEEPPISIGNFGPTGISISLLPDHTLKITDVQPGSPAAGKLNKDDVIVTINGKAPVGEVDPAVPYHDRRQLAQFITDAEAGDGKLAFSVKAAEGGAAKPITVAIPALGAYSKTWPIDCPKTAKMIRCAADHVATVAGPTGEGLTHHDMYDGWAIIFLLSTGQEEDLNVVRKVYKTRMANFTDDQVGSHNWFNGIQGIAACEYYLRTGDESVMPLINAICEAARKYQVHGGWSHWAKGINPQYTAGGLMNAAGIQNCTTLLLAKQCGANVNDETLKEAVKFFYRFAGHANVPYGDHRPEGGYGSNNGKTEMLALAMSAASRAVNGEVYALARDKSAQTALYDYPHILRGHTGGHGAIWHGIAAGLMADKKPDLYRVQMDNLRWFFELSRRHTGAFGASGAGRYDQESYGYATGIALTSPLKTLQITGAAQSPYAKPFRLSARPWGRQADLDFFNLDGGPAYQGTEDAPHIERQKIADMDAASLRRMAAHPEHVYRETAADTIREKQLYGLIEELLESDDPLQRHTGCMALNLFEPWGLRFHIGNRSRRSIDPAHFTPRMFNALMAIITDPTSALWSVDQALAALAVASPDQIKSRLDDLLPWIEHPEWWLKESGTIALTAAMKDEQAMQIILPTLIYQMSNNVHIKGRGVMGWMLERATTNGSPKIQRMVRDAQIRLFEDFVSVENVEPGVDISGITSVALESILGGILRDDQWQMRDDSMLILKAADLAVSRMGELRSRELGRIIDLLLAAGENLKGADEKKLGDILVNYFRPAVVGDDPEALKQQMAGGQVVGQMDKLLAIDRMAGVPGGWQMLGANAKGEQQWWFTNIDPSSEMHESSYNRYRPVDLPENLKGWYKADYDPAKHDWTSVKAKVFDITPKGYGVDGDWFAKYLPDAKEVMFIRKEFELDDLDFVFMRLSVYSRQGYDVYLNGNKIVSKSSRSKTWGAQRHYFDDKIRQHLKVGKNVIVARGFLQYFRGKAGGIDLFVEKLEFPPKVD